MSMFSKEEICWVYKMTGFLVPIELPFGRWGVWGWVGGCGVFGGAWVCLLWDAELWFPGV